MSPVEGLGGRFWGHSLSPFSFSHFAGAAYSMGPPGQRDMAKLASKAGSFSFV